jgi:hypothetical protein
LKYKSCSSPDISSYDNIFEQHLEAWIVEKPPRNSAGFCGGGLGLSWAVKPRKEEA